MSCFSNLRPAIVVVRFDSGVGHRGDRVSFIIIVLSVLFSPQLLLLCIVYV